MALSWTSLSRAQRSIGSNWWGISPKARSEHQLTNSAFQLADVARGLTYLHDWPSVHADLKGVSRASELPV